VEAEGDEYDMEDERSQDDDDEASESTEKDVENPMSTIARKRSTKEPLKIPSKKIRKEDECLQKAVDALGEIQKRRAGRTEEEEEDVYGKYVALQLKSLRENPSVALQVKHRIDTILFEARSQILQSQQPQPVPYQSGPQLNVLASAGWQGGQREPMFGGMQQRMQPMSYGWNATETPCSSGTGENQWNMMSWHNPSPISTDQAPTFIPVNKSINVMETERCGNVKDTLSVSSAIEDAYSTLQDL
jgi:hypothetical protein